MRGAAGQQIPSQPHLAGAKPGAPSSMPPQVQRTVSGQIRYVWRQLTGDTVLITRNGDDVPSPPPNSKRQRRNSGSAAASPFQAMATQTPQPQLQLPTPGATPAASAPTPVDPAVRYDAPAGSTRTDNQASKAQLEAKAAYETKMREQMAKQMQSATGNVTTPVVVSTPGQFATPATPQMNSEASPSNLSSTSPRQPGSALTQGLQMTRAHSKNSRVMGPPESPAVAKSSPRPIGVGVGKGTPKSEPLVSHLAFNVI